MSVANQPVVRAQVEDLLHSVCRVWSKHSGADLQIPPHVRSSDARQLKEFCVGLLENPNAHPWGAQLRHVESRRALSVAGSLFLFRKALPAAWSESEMVRAHRENLVPACRRDDRPQLPSDYFAHVRRVVASQFPEGWDHAYKSNCWTATPSVGSCTGSPRSQGGTRGLRPERRAFLRKALGEEYFEVDNTVKYLVVPTGGKGRGVTIAHPDMGLLGPLHRTMYDHLSELPWLLRGEAKPGRFRRFQRRKGEVFVSGDYEAATDRLPASVAEVVLDVLQSKSRHVPSTVWETARRFLKCKVLYPDLSCEMEVEGQLMGNLLCFPLLCIQNYVAFRYIFGESTPVKINGDDIVFRSTRADYERWASFVGRVGLTLSRGKTLVDEKFFSLNSAFFWSREDRAPRPVPVTRVSCFTKKFEDWGSLSGSFRSFTRGFGGPAKVEAEIIFLKWFRSRILQAGRSVRRGLGLPASTVSLQRSGLWRRECWYFDSVPACSDVLPPSPSRLKWGSVPPGWKRVNASSVRVTGEVRFVREGERPPKTGPCLREGELNRAFWREVVHRTWEEAPTRGALLESYQNEVRSSGFERLFQDWRRPGRLGLFKRRLPSCALSWKKLFRVSREAADRWDPSQRERLVWAPFDLEDPGQSGVETGASVDELIEWEGGLCFKPPAFDFDHRYALGYS